MTKLAQRWMRGSSAPETQLGPAAGQQVEIWLDLRWWGRAERWQRLRQRAERWQRSRVERSQRLRCRDRAERWQRLRQQVGTPRLRSGNRTESSQRRLQQVGRSRRLPWS